MARVGAPDSPAGPLDAPSRSAAAGLALLVTFLWSSSWILIRWGLDNEALRPLGFAAIRYGLAAALLLVWVVGRADHRQQLASLDRSLVGRILVLGVVFYAVTQGAQFVAIDNQPAATTSLVLSLTPLLVAFTARRSLQESASGRQLVGAVLVVAGAWLYFSGNLGATALGMAAAMVGLLANVGSSLLGRHLNRPANVSTVVITALSMATGALMLAAVALPLEGLPRVSGQAWLIIGWLAVVNTAVAFTLWNVSLRKLSAIESAGINNTMLIQIALLAWLFLAEAPGWIGLAAIGIISLGVFLTQVNSPLAWRPPQLEVVADGEVTPKGGGEAARSQSHTDYP